MSEEQQDPVVREERQQLPGYERVIRYYRRTCPHCGKAFEARGRQKYDTPACRLAHWEAQNPTAAADRARAYRRRKAGVTEPEKPPAKKRKPKPPAGA